MAHVQESLIILAASVTGSSGNVTVTGLDATNSYVLPTVTPGDTFYYSILTDGAGNWEFGLGTWTSAGNGTTTFGTFARTSPIKSKAGTAVPANFSGAPVTMIFDIPAEKALYIDGSNNIVNGEFVAKAAIALDFADLVARKVPTANNIVFRIGYGRTQADGLGGFFIWKAGDATAADDHTTAVTVNTLAPAVGTGRYLRVFEAFVPASIADEAQIPTGGIAQSTATNELRRRRPLIGGEASTSLKTIPQVENYIQASYSTLAAFKAVASTKWRNGDLIELRGVSAEGDVRLRPIGTWQASNTNTTDLDKTHVRPDDISGGNQGRLVFPFDINATSAPKLFEFTGDGVTVNFDIVRMIQSEDHALVFYDGLPVDKADYSVTIDTPANGQTRFTFGAFTPANALKIKIFA